MNPALLLLADSRLPAGGHAHSGGTEQAVTSGAVHDVPSLARFLRGRLHTAGTVAAALAAAACTQAATSPSTPLPAATSAAGSPPATAPPRIAPRAAAPPGVTMPQRAGGPDAGETAFESVVTDAGGGVGFPWVLLDAEADARTAAPAQREASRTQGRLLLRVARRVWPSPVLDELARDVPNPHHPIVLGVAAHAAGGTPEEAAMAAAYHAISGPATAAVRLLGLDPVAVHGLLAELTPDLTAVAAQAHLAAAGAHPHLWGTLPAYSSPALDLLAEQHARAQVRLFVS
ncbi:urease accessory UreF family protein [Nonomuraea sp. NPDC050786]|uniref:urease accessory protein UreF n=1 Tax=Nonomuraea sp. NPDC050786 TaxID=3154840 RepID=UPI0033F1F2DB